MAFKKNTVVGVSVTPSGNLEVAQIDFNSHTLLKYGSRKIAYENNRREIADLDIFKETLRDLLEELMIPKNTEIALNLPAVSFNVSDYPASLNSAQIKGVIEEELLENIYFKSNEPCFDFCELPNSTMQFRKVAYTAIQKTSLIEIALQIKELGYKLASIDTSVNASLNALVYSDRIKLAPDASWVLLFVENNCCRIIPMLGRNYVDSFEEKIGIGEVLGDAENYSTVIGAITPVLKNLPSQCLYIVSKTDLISAKELASKIKYNAPIVHQEANAYNTESFLEVVESIDPNTGRTISLDTIGAAISSDFAPYSSANLDLYNEQLGDIYILEQPPVLHWRSLKLVMSLENMIKLSILVALVVAGISALFYFPKQIEINTKEKDLAKLKQEISKIDQFLKENNSVSSSIFDEGDEIRIGIVHNKNIYSYYTIVGTEIPKKLWLTSLNLGKNTTIEGQADNLESVYSFFRNVKDYNPESNIKLQDLSLASNSEFTPLTEDGDIDADSVLTSMNADYYSFRISDAPKKVEQNNKDKKGKTTKKSSSVPRRNIEK